MMQHIADGADHIYLALGATDFRKKQNGLAVLVALKFKLDPHAGASVFLFSNKRHLAGQSGVREKGFKQIVYLDPLERQLRSAIHHSL